MYTSDTNHFGVDFQECGQGQAVSLWNMLAFPSLSSRQPFTLAVTLEHLVRTHCRPSRLNVRAKDRMLWLGRFAPGMTYIILVLPAIWTLTRSSHAWCSRHGHA
jgi:hypothetical protein